MATAVTTSSVVADANNAIDAAEKSLNTYNELINQIIPWKEFDDFIHTLQASKDQYSAKASNLVGEVETLLLDAKDNHNFSVEAVLRWCRTSVPVLEQFMRLFALTKEARVAEAQKILLLKVLDSGEEAMINAIDSLQKSLLSFNTAAGQLTALKYQLDSDFSKGSSFYEESVSKLRTEAYAGAAAGVIAGPIGLAISYSIAAGVVEGEMIPKMEKAFEDTKTKFENMRNLVTSAKGNIDKSKESIKTEITVIGAISSQIGATKTFAETWALVPEVLFNDLKNSTNKLIAQCKDYINAKS